LTSAKECVTTHPPKRPAPKTNDAGEFCSPHPLSATLIVVVARLKERFTTAEARSCRGIPRGTFFLLPSGRRKGCNGAVVARAKVKAPLRADLGCSSRYSSENGQALKLLENRSVEQGFLPTAVEQE